MLTEEAEECKVIKQKWSLANLRSFDLLYGSPFINDNLTERTLSYDRPVLKIIKIIGSN